MPNWETFNNEGDPLELMKRVIGTHLIRSGVDMERTKLEAREAFSRCRQQYNETIIRFKQCYDGRIAALKTLDEHVLDEPALVKYVSPDKEGMGNVGAKKQKGSKNIYNIQRNVLQWVTKWVLLTFASF